MEQYKTLSTGLFIISILTSIILMVGLLSTKYIGLECALTLQLIYFSQLLIKNVEKWPVSFSYLQYLKYSTGYNQIFALT